MLLPFIVLPVHHTSKSQNKSYPVQIVRQYSGGSSVVLHISFPVAAHFVCPSYANRPPHSSLRRYFGSPNSVGLSHVRPVSPPSSRLPSCCRIARTPSFIATVICVLSTSCEMSLNRRSFVPSMSKLENGTVGGKDARRLLTAPS
jgi:hypothetical protein